MSFRTDCIEDSAELGGLLARNNGDVQAATASYARLFARVHGYDLGGEQPHGGAALNAGLLRTEAGFCWVKCGMPQVEVSHRLAASLMATSVTKGQTAEIALPWDAFVVLVPSGMLKAAAFDERRGGEYFWSPESIFVLLSPRNGRLLVYMFGDCEVMSYDFDGLSGLSEASLSDEISDKFEPTTVREESWELGGTTDLLNMVADHNSRVIALAARLVFGACAELDNAERREEIERDSPAMKAAAGSRRGKPKAWTFKLTRDVKVDCRQWVGEYLGGSSGSKPYVQSLVRGHHKRQAHGAGGLLRKWIHVEPYWRGGEDAPIAVKTHKVG